MLIAAGLQPKYYQASIWFLIIKHGQELLYLKPSGRIEILDPTSFLTCTLQYPTRPLIIAKSITSLDINRYLEHNKC